MSGTADNSGAAPPGRPLEGLRALELSIAIAAPTVGRQLAHFGAEVIKIESPTNPDIARLFGSAWAREDMARLGRAYLDTGPYVSEMSSGKRSVGLDLKHPDGVAAALDLIRHTDVFVTNYSTPAVRALGLGYEACAAVKPDLVYVALPGFGSDESTPYYEYLAWGPNQAPLVGLDDLTGYPDQEPSGIATVAPPDYFSGYHAVIGVLSGLAHRDRTGEGSFVDLSQYEATVALLGPFLMQQAATGHTVGRMGNRQAGSAPEGVYPCRGEDRWVAISVTDDAAWQGLGRALGGPAWASDPRFASVEGRLANHDELDELIGAWTAQHSPEEVAAWLQEQGVAAYSVLDNSETILDPQVRDRGWFMVRPSSRFGRDLLTGSALRLTGTPGDIERAGPMMAEDTDALLRDVAGYDQARIDALVASGAAFRAHDPDIALRRPYDGYLHMLVRGTELRL
jgi:benzylsuccinate CoA-transferase BbsF subunit